MSQRLPSLNGLLGQERTESNKHCYQNDIYLLALSRDIIPLSFGSLRSRSTGCSSGKPLAMQKTANITIEATLSIVECVPRYHKTSHFSLSPRLKIGRDYTLINNYHVHITTRAW